MDCSYWRNVLILSVVISSEQCKHLIMLMLLTDNDSVLCHQVSSVVEFIGITAFLHHISMIVYKSTGKP